MPVPRPTEHLRESSAICAYLAEGTPLFPEDNGVAVYDGETEPMTPHVPRAERVVSFVAYVAEECTSPGS